MSFPDYIVPNVWPIEMINVFYLPKGDKKQKRVKHTPQECGKPHWQLTWYETWARNVLWFAWACGAILAWYTGPPVSIISLDWFSTWVLWIILRDLIICNISYGMWHWLVVHYFRDELSPYMYHTKLPYQKQTLHDFFWTNIGILHSSILEILFWRFWITHPDYVYYNFWAFPVWSLLWSVFVPYFREIHFYLAHRVMHPWSTKYFDIGKFLFKHVHSLHHKSYNPNAWNGLSMHPFEHLLYYSCCWVHVLMVQHPFHFLYNKYHCLLSPIAGGHDGLNGYFHWLHHMHPNCNYGGMGFPFDVWFGTFEDGSKWEKVEEFHNQ